MTESLPNSRVLCTTPLTPQGLHVSHSGAHHMYSHFVSPNIDLNPSPLASGGSVAAGAGAAAGQHLENKSGMLRFFQKKKIAPAAEEPSATGARTPKQTKRRLSLGRKSTKKVVHVS